MEAINLFLGSEYTIFVIGMDARMVAGSIEAKYAGIREFVSDDDEPGGLRLGQRFLEKITQVHFRIPHAEPSAFRNLVRGNVLDVDKEPRQTSPQEVARVQALIRAEQQTGKSIDQAAAAVTNQRPDIAAHVIRAAQQELIAKSLDDSPEFQRAVDTATRYLGFNPRKFKRFLNNFRLTAMIFNRRGLFDQGMFQLPVLANWTIMATRWPDLSDALTADPKFIELLKQAFEVNAKVREVQQRGASAEEVDSQLRHLSAYVRNRYIKRLIDADDLRALLNAMPEAETQSLSMYANYGASSDTLPAGT